MTELPAKGEGNDRWEVSTDFPVDIRTDPRLFTDMAKVLAYVRKWNVPILYARPHEYRDRTITPDSTWEWTEGPTGECGIDWKMKTIVWGQSPKGAKYVHPNALLHELAHVLDPVHPDDADEIGGTMLAFEHYSARYLNLGHREGWMEGVGLGDDDAKYLGFRGRDHVTWFDLTDVGRSRLLKRSLREAVRLGLLMESGRPTFQRNH